MARLFSYDHMHGQEKSGLWLTVGYFLLAGFGHSKKLQSIETKTVDLIWGKIRKEDLTIAAHTNGVRPMRDGMLLLFGQDLFELRFVLVCGNFKWQPQDQEIWSETMSSLATNCVWVSLSISRGLNLLVKHFRFLVEKLTWYWLKNHDDTWHGMDSSKFGCL